MIFLLKLDLDMTTIPKMKFLCQGIQKLHPEQTHTDRQYENTIFSHLHGGNE